MPLVHSAALPHTPQLLVRPDTEDRDLVLRVHAAYARVREEMVAARPDVICLIGGDHIEGFFLNAVPALAVFVGAEISGTFDRYRFTFPVHEPLARAIVEQGIDRGFDLAYSQALPLDYAFYVPLHFAMPDPPGRSCRSMSTSTCRPSPHRAAVTRGARRCGRSSTGDPNASP
jgi:Catalytic LigB subunit of aromatic ring-opening dioxygenase